MPAPHSVLGIVPARGGSKGIPRKNARSMAGKPLLEYTAHAALSASSLSRILLSTDDPEIAAIGRAAGLEAPFLRPAELSLDSTPMVQVVLHVIEWVQARGLTLRGSVRTTADQSTAQPSYHRPLCCAVMGARCGQRHLSSASSAGIQSSLGVLSVVYRFA